MKYQVMIGCDKFLHWDMIIRTNLVPCRCEETCCSPESDGFNGCDVTGSCWCQPSKEKGPTGPCWLVVYVYTGLAENITVMLQAPS